MRIVLDAADVISTWNNTTGNWSDAPRWSTNPLFPTNGNGGFTFDAVIGGGSVTLGQDITIEKFNLTGGTLTGPTSFTLTLNDLFTWTGGTLTGVGNVTADGGLTLSGGTGKTLSGSRVLVNNATATLSGGALTLQASGSPAAMLDNNGVFNATDEADILLFNTGGNQPSFANDGTFNKGGAGTTTTVGVIFNNAGIVNVDSGTLLLTGGGTSSGAFAVDALTTLNFGGGTHTLGAASSITSAGTVIFSAGDTNIGGSYTATSTTINGGTVNFNSAGATTNGIDFSSGTLAGSGTLTIDSGALAWTGGTMAGTGSTIIAAPASLTLSGATGKTLSGGRILTNNGTLTLSGGALTLQATGGALMAVLDNNNIFNVTDEADIFLQNFGGAQPSFANDGTFNKSGAGTTTSIGVTFNNAGTVNVDSGTLSLAADSTSSGDFSVDALATLNFAGTHTFNATSSVSGAGTVNIAGTVTGAGTTSLTGVTTNLTGTLTGTGGVTFNSNVLNWTGGTMTGSGTTTIAATSSLAISGGTGKTLSGSRVLVNNATATLSGVDPASLRQSGGHAGQQRRVQRHRRGRHSPLQHRRQPAQLRQGGAAFCRLGLDAGWRANHP